MKVPVDPNEILKFIVEAKAATYVGNGQATTSSRNASIDLEYSRGDFSYCDSYFGGKDFLGEEIIWFQSKPIWGENYYGKVLHPGVITPEETGKMIKASLSKQYLEGRFLGGFYYELMDWIYIDKNDGDWQSFIGEETITRDGIIVYRLNYHGGLIE